MDSRVRHENKSYCENGGNSAVFLKVPFVHVGITLRIITNNYLSLKTQGIHSIP